VQRADEGVEPRPHVLNIEHQHVHIGQHFGGGLLGFAVHRAHGHAAAGIAPVGDGGPVGLLAPEAVLGSEDGCHRHAPRPQGIHEVGAAHARSLVDDQAHALALQLGEVFIEPLGSYNYLGNAGRDAQRRRRGRGRRAGSPASRQGQQQRKSDFSG